MLPDCMDPPQIRLDLEGKRAEPLAVRRDDAGAVYVFPGGVQAEGACVRTGAFAEWRWRLRNPAGQKSPQVTCFRPLRLELPCRGWRSPVVHGSMGGLDEGIFPPTSWTQWTRRIATQGLSWAPIQARSAGGRSSNSSFGFFVIEDISGAGGWILGIGWSGDWVFEASRRGETLTIEGGMSALNLHLRPGEAFSQPTILAAEYRGSPADAQRLLRRHLRDHVQPALDGKPMRPVSFWDNYYGDRGQFSLGDLAEEVPLAEEAGFDYFVIDGGWTGGGQDGDFRSLIPHIGSWRPDPVRFANGFNDIRPLFAGRRIRPGLWFDIERASADSLSFQEHPELYFDGILKQDCHLLRLNRSDAMDYAFEEIARNVAAVDARWLRFDFNSDPAEVWKHHDNPGRRGETEIRYIENLYRLLERLLARFPAMAIENCASGGRRIDLETIRRTHTDWISDHTQSDAVIRYHLHGAMRWLPANHGNTSMAHAYLEPDRPVDWAAALHPAAYLSHFGGNFSVSDRLKPRTSEGRAELRRFVNLFNETAPAFAGDLYPLGRQEDTLFGPAGLAGIDAAGRRAAVFFGDPGAARSLSPGTFASLLARPPFVVAGDVDQFPAAALWTE